MIGMLTYGALVTAYISFILLLAAHGLDLSCGLQLCYMQS